MESTGRNANGPPVLVHPEMDKPLAGGFDGAEISVGDLRSVGRLIFRPNHLQLEVTDDLGEKSFWWEASGRSKRW